MFSKKLMGVCSAIRLFILTAYVNKFTLYLFSFSSTHLFTACGYTELQCSFYSILSADRSPHALPIHCPRPCIVMLQLSFGQRIKLDLVAVYVPHYTNLWQAKGRGAFLRVQSETIWFPIRCWRHVNVTIMSQRWAAPPFFNQSINQSINQCIY